MNAKNPHDPRDPDPRQVARCDSSHPSHSKLRKTFVLLSLDTTRGTVHFVIEGMSEWGSYDKLQSHSAYFYAEHNCPVNFMPVELICLNGDDDPHGVFDFVEAVWKISGQESTPEYFAEIWPQLKAKQ